jgi:two-component system sensor kinase FixL
MNQRPSFNPRSITLAAGWISTAVGSLVLLGWVLDLPLLKSVFPGFVTMKANTAVNFMLAGLALHFLQKPIKRLHQVPQGLAAVLFLISAATLLEYFLNQNLGLDELFFRDPASVFTSHPGRMAPMTAFNFLLIALALHFIKTRWSFISQILSLAVTWTSFIAFLGYLYNVQHLYQIFAFTSMALHTSLTFLILSAGLFFFDSTRGLASVASAATAGGMAIRKLLPLTILVPIAIGFLTLRGELAGYYTPAFNASLLLVTTILTLSVAICFIGSQLHFFDLSLQKNEERMRLILDGAYDAFVSIDSQGRITDWNPQAEATFGWSKSEALGKLLSETIIPIKYREAHQKGLQHFLSTGNSSILNRRVQMTALNREGEIFPVELTISPLKIGGTYLFNAFIHDITEREMAEQKQTQLVRELESANQELKDFAHIVSHDLKAPTYAIGSVIQWIQEDHEKELSGKMKEQMELVRQKSEQMRRLVEGVLDYSKVGQVREVRVILDLNKTAAEVIDFLTPPPHIEIRVENPLPIITAEKTRILQLFQNLIGNAIRYMDKPKGYIGINAVRDKNDFEIRVSDNGPGIEKEHLDKIFYLFQTFCSKGPSQGSGVGLAIVKRIAEIYYGSVRVESELGKGSTFIVTLPNSMLAFSGA